MRVSSGQRCRWYWGNAWYSISPTRSSTQTDIYHLHVKMVRETILLFLTGLVIGETFSQSTDEEGKIYNPISLIGPPPIIYYFIKLGTPRLFDKVSVVHPFSFSLFEAFLYLYLAEDVSCRGFSRCCSYSVRYINVCHPIAYHTYLYQFISFVFVFFSAYVVFTG